MGIKERRTKILLSLFLLSDVDFKPVALDKNVELPFDLALNQKTMSSLNSLVKDGLLEKATNSFSGEETAAESAEKPNLYRLTDAGFKILSLNFPFFRFLKQPWDGKWRVLSYEIPEKKRELRDKLRREVAGWGLGPWHRSFWLTPHPIIENLHVLVSDREEEKYIQAFEADHVFGDKENLIEKVWGKSNLDKQYRDLFKKWHEVLSSSPESSSPNEAKLQKFQIVVNEYVSILRNDPGLPAELVGKNWIGFEAFNIFKEIRSILLT